MREKVCMEKCVHTGRYITTLNMKVQRQTAKRQPGAILGCLFSLLLSVSFCCGDGADQHGMKCAAFLEQLLGGIVWDAA